MPISPLTRPAWSGAGMTPLFMGTQGPGGGDSFDATGPQRLGGGGLVSPPLRILLVDDETYLHRLVQRKLARHEGVFSSDLLTEFNVEGGIAVFEANQDSIAAILSDVMMPGGSGLDLYRHVRRLKPNLPFAFWSGGMPDKIRGELDAILQQDKRVRFFEKPVLNFNFVLDWFRDASMTARSI